MPINKGKRKRIDTGTSKAVKLSPWTFMTAVWIRSKPEPVTTMFLPPLKKRHTHIHIQSTTQ